MHLRFFLLIVVFIGILKIIFFTNIVNVEQHLHHEEKKYYSNSIPTKKSLYDDKIIVFIIIERSRNLEFDILRNIIKNKKCKQKFKIVHVEQSEGCLFNRGLLANIGFIESTKTWDNIGRFIIHDTDMFPENVMCYDKTEYTPVIHYATSASQYKFKMPYKTYFGGVVGFIPSVYARINGFSNMFWGWGGEDDDIYNRIINNGFTIFAYTSGRFLNTEHERDKSNLKNNIVTLSTGNRTNDGLTDCLKYTKPITTIIDNEEIHIAVYINKTLCTILVPTQKNEKSIFSSSKKFVLNNNRDSIESRPKFLQRDNPKYTENSIQSTKNSIQSTKNSIQSTENSIQSTENSIQSTENSKRTYKIFSRIGKNKNLEPDKPFLKIDIKSNSLF